MPRIQIHSDFFCPLLAHADARFWHNTVNSICLQLVSVRGVYNNDDVACKAFLELCVCFEQCCFNAPCFSNLPSISSFIPFSPLSHPSCHPADNRKTLGAFPNQPCVQNRRTSASDGHTETVPAPVKHLPEYIENTAHAKGLQVQFCPWEVRCRLRSCSWDHHNSVTPQQKLPGCCCGRCCLTPQHICVVGWTTFTDCC